MPDQHFLGITCDYSTVHSCVFISNLCYMSDWLWEIWNLTYYLASCSKRKLIPSPGQIREEKIIKIVIKFHRVYFDIFLPVLLILLRILQMFNKLKFILFKSGTHKQSNYETRSTCFVYLANNCSKWQSLSAHPSARFGTN